MAKCLYTEDCQKGNSIKKEKIAKINLSKIQNLIDNKKINANEIINIENLKRIKILNSSYAVFKILGTGEIKDKINIEANFSSKSAKEKIEKVGGKLTLRKK